MLLRFNTCKILSISTELAAKRIAVHHLQMSRCRQKEIPQGILRKISICKESNLNEAQLTS